MDEIFDSGKDTSRRDFLRNAGLSAIAAALGERQSFAANPPVAAQAPAKPAAAASDPGKRFIAMQISAQ